MNGSNADLIKQIHASRRCAVNGLIIFDYAHLKDSYVVIRKSEAYVINMHISHYKEGNIFNQEETRTRKLLLHKKEILKLDDKIKISGYK